MPIYKSKFIMDAIKDIEEAGDFSISISCINPINESVSKTINAPKAGEGKINFLYNGIGTTPHPLRVKVVNFKPSSADLEIPIDPESKEVRVSTKLMPTKKRKAAENMVYTAAGIGLELFEDIRDYYGYKDSNGTHPADKSKEAIIKKKIEKIANKSPKDLEVYLKKGKSAVKWVTD